ncbi:glutamate/gamma-aminobutyrate family transporter YjeM, partial [Limosilactobacillus fermentum]
KKNLDYPFVVFKNRLWTNILVVVVEIILIVGILFTFVQPLLEHDYQTAFWTIAGPFFFAIVALVFYQISARRHNVDPNE